MKPKNNLSRAEKLALHTLWCNADLTVSPEEKSNLTVILNTLGKTWRKCWPY
jgi:hypothetical protein